MTDDWRLKIGKISPSVYVHSTEYHAMLPEGADMAVVTTNVEQITESNLSEAVEEAETAIRRLDDRDVDCIIAGGAPIYALNQSGSATLSEVRAAVDAPIASSLECHVDALHALSADSVLAVTPYTEERNRERVEYLEDNGLSVAAIDGLGSTTVAEFVNEPPSTFYRMAVDLAESTDAAFDAVYIPCAALELADYIAPLEQDIGKPVVTSAQAQVWKAFELGGINPIIEGYGRLFDAVRE